jgi:hypothetical protein
VTRSIGIRMMIVSVVLLLAFFVTSENAHAQLAVSTACSSYQIDPVTGEKVTQSAYVGLTNRIVSCVRDTLDSATSQFFNSSTGFYHLVTDGITGVTTLAVIVFGIMAAFGMLEKVGRDSIMLLLKISMVAYFSANSDYLYHKVIGMMDSTALAVVSFVPASGASDNSGSDFQDVTCLQNMINVQQALDPKKAATGPWLAMDCMIDSVIGIKVEPKGGIQPNALTQGKAYNEKLKNTNNAQGAKENGLSRGMLFFFFSSYSTSIMGIILAIIGFIFIWGMVNIIIKSLFIYIAGYLGIAVMMMLAPLFIPLVLFQVTKQYFDKWVKLVISFALQPIIILVFVMLSISAVDLATFSGDYSVMYRIAGEESRKNDFSLNRHLTCLRNKSNPATCLPANTVYDKDQHVVIDERKPIKLFDVKADTKDKTPIDGTMADSIIDGLETSKCTKALMDADPELKKHCEQSYPVQTFRQNLNWDVMADARNPAVVVDTAAGVQDAAEQISKEVMAAVIFAAVVVFVMKELLSVIPMVAYDLVGDYGQMQGLGKISGIPGQQGARSGLGGMMSGGKSP